MIIFGLSGISAQGPGSAAPRNSQLDRAMFMAQVDRQDLRIDWYHTDFDVVVGRNTTVMDVLENPFYAPSFVQVYAARLNGSLGSVTPHDLFLTALDISGASLDRFHGSGASQRSLMEVFEDMQVRFNRVPLSPGTRQVLIKQIRNLPEGLEESLVILSEALMEAATLRQEALARLSASEYRMIVDNPMEYFFDDRNPDRINFFLAETKSQITVLRVMQKIDLTKIFMGTKILTEAIEITRPKLQWVHKRTIAVQNAEILLEFDSPLGLILVGGPGVNRHDRDAALLLDLDGSDVYSNNAGGSLHVRGGIACLIDMGGNDLYTDLRAGVQGSGLLGIGILVDFHGEDTYVGGDWSQGAALGGAGIVYDEKGSDKYRAGVLSQGSGTFGIGMNIDVDGHDFFIGDSFCQGFGSTLGFGGLINIWGRDNYIAGTAGTDRFSRMDGIAQGSAAGCRAQNRDRDLGVWGGIGMLVDAHGNDTYRSKYNSQGSGFFLSLGVLVDNEGNDFYDCTGNSQGYGAAFAAGLLIDQEGEDLYTGIRLVQSAVEGDALGMLLDYSGDDIYRHTGSCGQACGFPPGGFALFIDYRGTDRYEGGGRAQGYVLPPANPLHWPFACLIDHEGRDIYFSPGSLELFHENDTAWQNSRGGVGIDTVINPPMYFAGQQGSSRIQHYQMDAVKTLETLEPNKLSRLGSLDAYTRFFAQSDIVNRGVEILPEIAGAVDLGHSEFRRTLEDAIRLILDDPAARNHLPALQPMLSSIDPETKHFVLELYARYEFKGASHLLQNLLDDTSPRVRSSAARVLGITRDTQSVPELLKMAGHDVNPACRREAIRAIASIEPENHRAAFRESLRDPDPTVRITAMEAVGEIQDRESVGILQLMAAAEDEYIRRSAGKALIRIGDKSGFPVLFKSISFGSEDNQDPYAPGSVPAFLMEYTGVNFGFDVDEWESWWAEQEFRLDLGLQCAAREEYDRFIKRVHKLDAPETIRMIGNLRNSCPGYTGYDRYLAEPIHKKAVQLLATGKIGVLNSARILSEYAVEMDPSRPEYYLTRAKIVMKAGDMGEAEKILNGCRDRFRHSKEFMEDSGRLLAEIASAGQ